MTGYIVTGTDTGIGKTMFAAGLAAALDAVYWKPIQAGLDEAGDRETVGTLGVRRTLPEAYRLVTPCSPHRAAEIDGLEIDPARLALPPGDRSLVVEGAGGVLVPVTRQLLFADLFARWGLPAILVAQTTLGTINHSLLSVEALRTRGIPIRGIAFVGEEEDDSERTIAAIAGVERLGRLPRLDPLNATTLAAAFSAAFDVRALAA